MLTLINCRGFNHWLLTYSWQKIRMTDGEMVRATMLEF